MKAPSMLKEAPHAREYEWVDCTLKAVRLSGLEPPRNFSDTPPSLRGLSGGRWIASGEPFEHFQHVRVVLDALIEGNGGHDGVRIAVVHLQGTLMIGIQRHHHDRPVGLIVGLKLALQGLRIGQVLGLRQEVHKTRHVLERDVQALAVGRMEAVAGVPSERHVALHPFRRRGDLAGVEADETGVELADGRGALNQEFLAIVHGRIAPPGRLAPVDGNGQLPLVLHARDTESHALGAKESHDFVAGLGRVAGAQQHDQGADVLVFLSEDETGGFADFGAAPVGADHELGADGGCAAVGVVNGESGDGAVGGGFKVLGRGRSDETEVRVLRCQVHERLADHLVVEHQVIRMGNGQVL